jgi:arsenite methyltransferase
MTEAMIKRARSNAEKLNFHNVEFRLGEIESLPLSSSVADVVISNCVLNLVPDKRQAFSEIYRILKPGGHFSISDIVLMGVLPGKILETAELYAGCVSGGIPKEEYLQVIRDVGFDNITIQKEKAVIVPDEVLGNYLSPDEIQSYRESGAGVYSVTVYAEKKKEECCDKGTCCK